MSAKREGPRDDAGATARPWRKDLDSLAQSWRVVDAEGRQVCWVTFEEQAGTIVAAVNAYDPATPRRCAQHAAVPRIDLCAIIGTDGPTGEECAACAQEMGAHDSRARLQRAEALAGALRHAAAAFGTICNYEDGLPKAEGTARLGLNAVQSFARRNFDEARAALAAWEAGK